MRRQNDVIEAAGGRVVLVGMGAPAEAEAFRMRFDVSFPIICDPERRLYDAFHLRRMGALDFLSPFLALKGLAAMGEGHLMGLPAGDVKQLAGAFVVDSEGRIRFAHLSRDASDLVSVDDIVDALGKNDA